MVKGSIGLVNIDLGYQKCINEKRNNLGLVNPVKSLCVLLSLPHQRLPLLHKSSFEFGIFSLRISYHADKLLCMDLVKILVWVMVTLVSIIGQIFH